MSSLDHSYASVHMCGSFFAYIGWRKYMEDACVTISPFTYKNYSLFAVFDGHGGKCVHNSGP
jgi:serine/threonine protein phosphatase PrpC